jgi:hypothetical protein
LEKISDFELPIAPACEQAGIFALQEKSLDFALELPTASREPILLKIQFKSIL